VSDILSYNGAVTFEEAGTWTVGEYEGKPGTYKQTARGVLELELILQHFSVERWSPLNDASFTSCLVVDALAIESTKMQGTFLAFVVAPIPTDSAEWSCWLISGSGGSVKISGYRGGEVCQS
jgi:hypothetical protein